MVSVNPPPGGYLQFTNCELSEHTTCQEGEVSESEKPLKQGGKTHKGRWVRNVVSTGFPVELFPLHRILVAE